MKVGIIIEYSNIYEIKIVKTLYSTDGGAGIEEQFWETVVNHLISLPEVGVTDLPNKKRFFVFPKLDESKFPMLPQAFYLEPRLRPGNFLGDKFDNYFNNEYHDYYGKWKLIIL